MVPIGVVYFLGAVAVFMANYRRLDDRNERRRARIVAAGTVMLIAGMLPYYVMLLPSVASLNLDTFFMSHGVFAAFNLLTMAFPLSIAYAILRHRAFDIPLVIRQGLKYAVARRTLVAVLPFLGAILVIDLLNHGDQPLGAILRERGWIYAALGAIAILAQRRQRGWMDGCARPALLP
jgi:sigma-B regulation protein RsbU (phosphoserine phosphatase)